MFSWVRYKQFFWRHKEVNHSSGFHLDALKVFLEKLNKFQPFLKIRSHLIEENVAFLNLKVKPNQGKLEMDLYFRSDDRHQYFHYTSPNLEHIKQSIVVSKNLSVKRICSQAEDFRKHTADVISCI